VRHIHQDLEYIDSTPLQKIQILVLISTVKMVPNSDLWLPWPYLSFDIKEAMINSLSYIMEQGSIGRWYNHLRTNMNHVIGA
jgi:hypothetical protein